jgi:hypothetical protein
MSSIEEVKTGITEATDIAGKAVSALQQALTSLEEAQGFLSRTLEGSPKADANDAQNLLYGAAGNIIEIQQNIEAARQAAHAVRDRLGSDAVGSTLSSPTQSAAAPTQPAQQTTSPENPTAETPRPPEFIKAGQVGLFLNNEPLSRSTLVNNRPYLLRLHLPSDTVQYPANYLANFRDGKHFISPGNYNFAQHLREYAATGEAQAVIEQEIANFEAAVAEAFASSRYPGYITSAKVAQLLGVGGATVKDWRDRNQLEAEMSEEGRPLISLEQFRRLYRWARPSTEITNED